VQKYRTAVEATYYTIIGRMRFSRWLPKATNIHSEYVILIFHGNNDYVNAPECYK